MPAGRPRIEFDKQEIKRMKRIRTQGAKESADSTKKSTKDLSPIEKVAWLEGANRPSKEVHEASSEAKRAGHTWREIANARGMGDDHDAGRKVATTHLKWHKDNNIQRDI